MEIDKFKELYDFTTLWFSPYQDGACVKGGTIEFDVWHPKGCSDNILSRIVEKASAEIIGLISKFKNYPLIVHGQWCPVVIVCGSKNWNNYNIIYKKLSELSKGTTILGGGYPGADILARTAAFDLGLDVLEFPSPWIYESWRGPDSMFRGKRNLVLAFHDDIKNADGTNKIIEEAKKRDIKVEIIKEE